MALLARFEKEQRRLLPKAFKSWVTAHHGKETQARFFQVDSCLIQQMPDYLCDGWLEYDRFIGVDLDGMSLFDSHKWVEEWGLLESLVLIHGDGHTWTALDYGQGKAEPPVIFIESDDRRFVILAERFSDFVDRLTCLDPF